MTAVIPLLHPSVLVDSHQARRRDRLSNRSAPALRAKETLIMDVHRLAMPVWDLRDALNDAAECRYLPELHDGPDDPDSESAEERAAREEVARQICRECPAAGFCLEYAMRVQPERGIWAGFTVEEIALVADAGRIARELGEVA